MATQTPSRIRVLYVDDDPSFGDLVSILLERDFLEFEVLTAHTAEEGFDVLDAHNIDCIVSDYELCETNGIQFLREVRPTYPKLPFLLFTGKGSEEIAAEAMREGLTEYVQKGGAEKISLLGTQIRNAVSAHRVEQERHERVKELSVLHDATTILFEDRSLDERLDELVRTIPAGWHHPEHTAARIQIDDKPYATPSFSETEWMLETSVTTSSGTRAVVEIAYTAPWNERGTPFSEEEEDLLTSIGNILRSHLERADVIEELERMNHQLEALLDVTPAVVHLKDIEGRYLRVNNEYESLFETPRSEILGKTVEDVHSGEIAETFVEHDQQVLERETTLEFEETIEHDGETLTYLTARVPLFDESGEPYAVYGISTDISEQTELIEERERILDRMTDAFFAVDTEWQFTFVNERAAELLNRDADDLVGTYLWEEFPEATDSAFAEEYHRAMESQETASFEARYDPLETTFEVRAYPSETGLSVYFRDVRST